MTFGLGGYMTTDGRGPAILHGYSCGNRDASEGEGGLSFDNQLKPVSLRPCEPPRKDHPESSTPPCHILAHVHQKQPRRRLSLPPFSFPSLYKKNLKKRRRKK
jgi:hypothetical protein